MSANNTPSYRYDEFKEEFRTYGSNDRGQVMQLRAGEENKRGLSVRFSSDVEEPYMARIRVAKIIEDILVPEQVGRDKVALLERTNAFIKGRVWYIESPDELRAKRLKSEQDAEVAKLKLLIEPGEDGEESMLTLDLDKMSHRNMVKLAKSIGVPVVSGKSKKGLSTLPLRNAIKGKLGLDLPMKKAASKPPEKTVKTTVKNEVT